MRDQNDENKTKKDVEEKLDELQAKWVIGKQRGEEVPLEKEDLEELLESGRVNWGWLGKEERKLLKDRKGEFEKEKNKMTLEQKIEKVTKFVNLVMEGLLDKSIGEVEKNTPKEDWDILSSDVKVSVGVEYFRKENGVSFFEFRERAHKAFFEQLVKMEGGNV